ncbi:hypothetical protein [Methylobacterium nodulans]|nr:hypothetical protein [Methylobacterium nodulans]
MSKRTKPDPPADPAAAARRLGRRPYEPTAENRKMVQAMVSYGIRQEEIATALGISTVTLRKHFRRELDVGETLANAAVANALFKAATGGGPQKVTAQIFWLKTRAKWKEPPREVSGPNGAPITTATIDLKRLSDEQLKALEAIFGDLAGGSGGHDGGAPGGEGEAGA